MVTRNCQNLQAVVIDRALHDELTAGPTRPNGALAQEAAGTRNLPTAQAALLTPIRDERDPTNADEAAMQPAASGEVTYRIARTATDDLPGGTTVEAGRMSCLHTGSA